MRLVALLAVLVVGGVGTGAWPAVAASKNVTMTATAYDPATVSVDVNDDVFADAMAGWLAGQIESSEQ